MSQQPVRQQVNEGLGRLEPCAIALLAAGATLLLMGVLKVCRALWEDTRQMLNAVTPW